MIGPFFSVGPCRKESLNATSDITGWIGSLQSALISCNWTTVSTFEGSGGTLGITMRTFPTPNLQTAQLTVFWDGSEAPFGAGPIISFLMADANANNQNYIGFVTLPASKTFTMIFGPHQFFLWSTDAGAFQLNYVMGGVPVTMGKGQVYWGMGDSGTFGGAPSFTNTLAATVGQGTWAYLLNNIIVTRLTVGSNLPPQLLVQRSNSFEATDPLAFANGLVSVIEPILTLLSETYVYLWDAVVISHSFATNLTFNISNRTFEVLTLGYALGALAVVADDSAKLTEPGYAY